MDHQEAQRKQNAKKMGASAGPMNTMEGAFPQNYRPTNTGAEDEENRLPDW